ncbi:MAG TPA: lysophospholipid acyltransferase family protein [Pseudonocardiaceae bacterium]|nr:lysophospholipid acyltransferase family protein [Pseudonocardiaceae bacterium]
MRRAREKGGFSVWLGIVVCYPLTRLLARCRFEGLEHIPKTGAVLVVCNHISYLDAIYTAVFVHRRGRIPHFLAKAALWQVPMLRGVLHGTGQIPVYRGHADAGTSLREAEQALRAGQAVLIYPEGTITRDPAFWPMVARTGMARLALGGVVPVVPVVHWGTHRVYDHYRRRFRPLPRAEVVVRAGAAVDLSGFRDRPVDRQLLHEVTEWVMGEVRDLLAEVRGEQAPAGFFIPSGPAQDGGTEL